MHQPKARQVENPKKYAVTSYKLDLPIKVSVRKSRIAASNDDGDEDGDDKDGLV